MIEQAIQRAVDSAVSGIRNEVVKPLIDSNNKLTQLVDGQKVMIRNQHTRIVELESEYDFLCNEVDDLKLSVNDLEQYGRRSNLRLSNMMIGPPDATESDVTQHTVKFLNDSVLKTNSEGSSATPITADDIDRCHPIGPMRLGKRNVIVKFYKYHTKQAVYQAKSNLKGDNHRRFISEDLTRHNYGLVQSLMRHRRGGGITSFWTRDGTIYAKKVVDDRPTKIRTEYDINNLIGRQNPPPAHIVRRESNDTFMDMGINPLHH